MTYGEIEIVAFCKINERILEKNGEQINYSRVNCQRKERRL